jgi:hypothetical protein
MGESFASLDIETTLAVRIHPGKWGYRYEAAVHVTSCGGTD